ncbi:MAG: hypothetical protein J2P23_03240, partial [Microlunatus sp.]|nr:hypothetical protein [Microlunatus sp.]
RLQLEIVSNSVTSTFDVTDDVTDGPLKEANPCHRSKRLTLSESRRRPALRIWEQKIAGSSPVAPTMKHLLKRLFLR